MMMGRPPILQLLKFSIENGNFTNLFMGKKRRAKQSQGEKSERLRLGMLFPVKHV